ncbi:hypothetical protein AVEN_121646-1 [Araneus ventricosus]|uniref:Uncharacterized protein n=1 Tax=Araneus ventricosus TaxID=182803 RepID=A0A4Y2KU16_ARAVE|nr:hypothetical protein AVEN_121646-1 [Araneus ventricosus]
MRPNRYLEYAKCLPGRTLKGNWPTFVRGAGEPVKPRAVSPAEIRFPQQSTPPTSSKSFSARPLVWLEGALVSGSGPALPLSFKSQNREIEVLPTLKIVQAI